MRYEDDGKLELTEAAQVDEDVSDEHRHRAVGEVDYASAAVLEDKALTEDGEGGTGTQAENQEEQVAGHYVSFTSRRCTRRGGGVRPALGRADPGAVISRRCPRSSPSKSPSCSCRAG